MAIEDILNNIEDENLKSQLQSEVENERSSYQTQIQNLSTEKEKLNSKKEEFADEKRKLKEKFGEFENEDLEAFRKLKQDNKFNQYKEDWEKYGIEGVLKQAREEVDSQYKGTLEEKDNELQNTLTEKQKLEQQLQNLTKQNIISKSAQNVEDLQTGAQEFLQYIADQQFELDENGQTLVMKDGKRNSKGEPVTFEEYINSKEAREKHPFIFQGKEGAGVNGGSGGGTGGKMTQEEVAEHLKSFEGAARFEEYNRIKKEGLMEE